MKPENDCIEFSSVAIDFDGFITAPNELSWLLVTYDLAKQFGATDEEAEDERSQHTEIFGQYLQGELSFEESSLRLKKLWTKNGERVIQRKHLDAAVENLNYHIRQDLEVLVNLLNELRKLGVKVFLITTAPPMIIDYVNKFLQLDAAVAGYDFKYTPCIIHEKYHPEEDILEEITYTDKILTEGIGVWKRQVYRDLANGAGLDLSTRAYWGNDRHDALAMEDTGWGVILSSKRMYHGQNKNIIMAPTFRELDMAVRKQDCRLRSVA